MRNLLCGLGLALGLLLTEAGATQTADWQAVAFMYHRFGESAHPSTSVTLEQFESHLDHLEQNDYRVWPLEQVVEHLLAGKPVPDRTVSITIDDAYTSVYTEAYPRLRERGLPYTVFVATDPVDRGSPGFMSWDQMREMQRHGAAFANHSSTHDHLVRRGEDETEADYRERLRRDIVRAQQRLETELGAENVPQLFAYPYGEYSAVVAELVEELGYVAFGQHSGAIGPHSDTRALPRFPMAEAYAAVDEFAQKAASKSLPVTSLEPWNPLIADANPPRMRVRLADSTARLDQLACFVSRQGRIDVTWEDRDARVFTVQPPRPLGVGRTRYNCTAPSPEAGRFYWFSQQWIRLPD
ncbi:MAG: polysaccharide deacetylase family protein [Ectothiorhodospiraceae bacterium]|nr:polysaccharide deacetylase family protein [Ectothiorhodospiraceae bacterium]